MYTLKFKFRFVLSFENSTGIIILIETTRIFICNRGYC
jgi:hypothetical protein